MKTDLISDAIERNKLKLLKTLITNENINTYSESEKYNGYTPLLIACMLNNYGIIDFLINSGADVNKKSIGQMSDISALNMILRRGKITDHASLYKSINLLLKKGAKVNTFTPDNHSPLGSAVINNFTDITKLLLDSGADPNIMIGYDNTPLKEALKNQNHEIAELLLKKGADVNFHSREIADLDSILIYCVKKRNIEAVKFLLDHGVDITYKNSKENFALDIATENGDKDIIDLLKINL